MALLPRKERFVALQHRDFRLLFIGQFLSFIGSQMQFTAINWHVYELLQGQEMQVTLFGRTFALGAEALGLGSLGLVRIIPVLFFALYGGLMADSFNRKKLVLWMNVLLVFPAAILAFLSYSGKASVWAIYLLTAIASAAVAFENPARSGIVPNIVPKEHFSNAVTVATMISQIAAIVGPALAGVLLMRANVGLIYAVNAVSYLAIVISMLMMSYKGKRPEKSEGFGWKALTEGFRFVYHEKIIWSSMMLDFVATFFASANTMLPLVAGDILKVGARGYGLLSTAQSAGALAASALLSLRDDIRRLGPVLLGSVAIFGAATALFGISTNFTLSYLLFAATGAMDTVSMVIRNSVRQIITPDHLRGRMTGVNMMFFRGGPQLGELEAGLVASAFGVPFAIISGGLLTIACVGLIALRNPKLRTYTREMMLAEAVTNGA